uniref:Rho-GAP domain-containing protein n=1 Tax=Macrostomum lignano TaxID=282301 RepID=A0A1I8FAE9_9PLAT
MRHRLKYLHLYGVKPKQASRFLTVLSELENLVLARHQFGKPQVQQQVRETVQLAELPAPRLEHLDVSGNKLKLDVGLLRQLPCWPGRALKFLGFAMVDDEQAERRAGAGPVEIAGFDTEDQLIRCLHRYRDRENYMQQTLCAVFLHTNHMFNLRRAAAQSNVSGCSCKLAGTARAVQSDSRYQLSFKLCPAVRNTVVDLVLNAMGNFPKQQTVAEECPAHPCATIASCIRPSSTALWCLSLVCDGLVQFSDRSTWCAHAGGHREHRCQAKVSSRDLALLGSQERLFAARRGRGWSQDARAGCCGRSWPTCPSRRAASDLDPTLKTAQPAREARQCILPKCLGLLNNIAEMPATRKSLLVADIISMLSQLLTDSSLSVRAYFAAGVLANLSLLPDRVWLERLSERPRAPPCCQPLATPCCPGSFRPFVRLLEPRRHPSAPAVVAVGHQRQVLLQGTRQNLPAAPVAQTVAQHPRALLPPDAVLLPPAARAFDDPARAAAGRRADEQLAPLTRPTPTTSTKSTKSRRAVPSRSKINSATRSAALAAEILALLAGGGGTRPRPLLPPMRRRPAASRAAAGSSDDEEDETRRSRRRRRIGKWWRRRTGACGGGGGSGQRSNVGGEASNGDAARDDEQLLGAVGGGGGVAAEASTALKAAAANPLCCSRRGPPAGRWRPGRPLPAQVVQRRRRSASARSPETGGLRGQLAAGSPRSHHTHTGRLASSLVRFASLIEFSSKQRVSGPLDCALPSAGRVAAKDKAGLAVPLLSCDWPAACLSLAKAGVH